MNRTVDLVCCWVSLDAEYEAMLNEHVGTVGEQTGSHAARFREIGEIEYSIAFAKRFMPWLNTIFIVTNGQKPPDSVLSLPTVKWITHEQIIPDEFLPTFNYHAIEPHLVNIPGLAEHFILTSDDFFVGHPIEKEWFFGRSGNGRFLHAFGSLVTKDGVVNNWTENLRRSNDALNAKYGAYERKIFAHCPQIMQRSKWLTTLARYDDTIRATMSSKVRMPTDVIFRILYTYDLLYEAWGARNFEELAELSDGDICVTPRKTNCYVPLKKYDERFLSTLEYLEEKRPKFFCLNDNIAQSDFDKIRDAVLRFLREY